MNLEFQRGRYSAQYQQQQIEAGGGLATKHNISLSAVSYGWSVYDDMGLLIVILGVLGFLAYLVTRRVRWDSLVPYSLLAALPFNILMLWLGQTILVVPQSDPPGFFNTRYGLMMVPAAAFFTAFFVATVIRRLPFQRLIASAALVLIVAGQFTPYLSGWPGSIITVLDGLNGSITSRPLLPTIGRYLRDHYDGGGILLDETNVPAVRAIHDSRLPLRETIASYSGPLWTGALKDPRPIVRWVIMPPDDRKDLVWEALQSNSNFTKNYTLQFEDKGYAVYRLNEPVYRQSGP